MSFGGSGKAFAVASLISLRGKEIASEAFTTPETPALEETAWNDASFEFGRHYFLDDEASLPRLRIILHEKGRLLKKARPVGMCEINLGRQVSSDGSEMDAWLPLKKGILRLKGEPAGQVRVSLRFVQHASSEVTEASSEALTEPDQAFLAEDAEYADFEPNQLRIALVSARELLAMDVGMNVLSGKAATSDPFARVTLNGSTVATSSVKEKTLAPVWQEQFAVDVQDPSTAIELVVEDRDKVGTSDFMGKTVINLQNYHSKELVGPRDFVLKGRSGEVDKPRGQVRFAARWIFDPEAKARLEKQTSRGSRGRALSFLRLGSRAEESEDEGVDAEYGSSEALDEDQLAQQAEARAKAKAELEAELSSIEIKSGDYQLQVHIIEGRELKGEDVQGTSDPMVYIEAFGRRQASRIVKASNNPVFDERFIFSLRGLDKDEVNEAVIKITAMDSDTFPNGSDVIGSAQFDASYVYFQKGHEIHRTWVALVDDTNPKDVGIQGYLRVSLALLGPGDKLQVHDEEAERRAEEAKAGDEDVGDVIMPPTLAVSQSYVVASIYRAEYLPLMDKDLNPFSSAGGVDAFVTASFGGLEKPIQTTVKTVKGVRASLNPIFNTELWIPVNEPSFQSKVHFQVMDYKTVGAAALIGRFSANYKALKTQQGQMTQVYWQNLYGPAPPGFLEAPVVPGVTEDHHGKYLQLPSKAPAYRGRVLMRLRLEDGLPKKRDGGTYGSYDEFLHDRKGRRKIKGPRVMPRSEEMEMRVLLISGMGLPEFTLFGKLRVRVSCGHVRAMSKAVSVRGRAAQFQEELVLSGLDVPEDPREVPDTFVHLLREPKLPNAPWVPICFARIDTNALVAGDFARARARWYHLGEDKVLNALSGDNFPGALLMQVGIGGHHEVAEGLTEPSSLWRKGFSLLENPRPAQLRVHVFRARNLEAADADGLIDPVINVSWKGKERETETLRKTLNPGYYQTFVFDDTAFAELSYNPMVTLKVFDQDFFPIQRREFVSMCFLDLATAKVVTAEDVGAPGYTPDVSESNWRPLFREETGDAGGEVLASLEVVFKTRPSEQIPEPQDIHPEEVDAVVEVFALGLRDMQPFMFMPMQAPSVAIECDDVRGKTYEITTAPSKRPTPEDPNFLEIVRMPVKLPKNPLFVGDLKLRVHDRRMGGYRNPMVAQASIALDTRAPWAPSFEPETPGALATGGAERSFRGRARTGGAEEKAATETKLADPVDDGAGVTAGTPLAVTQQSAGDGAPSDAAGLGAGAGDDDEEEDERKYLKGREVIQGRFEETDSGMPFETFPLTRGESGRVVGHFKGWVRLVRMPESGKMGDIPDVLDEASMTQLLKPAPYRMRLYVLRALNLEAKDSASWHGRPGRSDPYLKVSLGKESMDDRKNAVEDAVDADLYKLVDFPCELPGAGRLRVQVMDKDEIGNDDLIGSTTIDLEDRWFSTTWQQAGRANRRDGRENRDGMPSQVRWDTKPLEMRPLFVPSTASPQGTLECWVDILRPQEASAFPPVDVSLPPRQQFEVRVVVWKLAHVPPADTLAGQNMTDMMCKLWIEGCEKQQTDTHWRAKRGKGSFNWRMKFDVELGSGAVATKFPYLHFQLWDRDVLKWNDMICETSVPLGKHFRRAYRLKNQVIEVFSDQERKAKAAKAERAKVQQAGAEPASTYNPLGSARTSSAGGAPGEEADGGARDKAERDEEEKEAFQSLLKMAKSTVGMADPPDSQMFQLWRKDFNTQERRKMGKVWLSVSIWPKRQAEGFPSGTGRSAPNVNPYLPPPVGRMHFSLNPFYVFYELCGPQLMCRFLLCLCFVITLLLLVFCQPLINVLIAIAFR